jgi:hypothetical protein
VEDLVRAKKTGLEDALWVALQTLREHSQILETMASDDRSVGWNRNANDYATRAIGMRNAARELHDLIRSL